MKTIRTNTFETNSSSSHSITIDRKRLLKFPDLKDEYLEIQTNDFGWENREYNDWSTKLSYLVTDLKYVDEYTKNRIQDYIERALRIECGAKEVRFFDEYDGYIDHQSQGTATEEIETYEDVLHFLFSPDSTLRTGNDNDDY